MSELAPEFDPRFERKALLDEINDRLAESGEVIVGRGSTTVMLWEGREETGEVDEYGLPVPGLAIRMSRQDSQKYDFKTGEGYVSTYIAVHVREPVPDDDQDPTFNPYVIDPHADVTKMAPDEAAALAVTDEYVRDALKRATVTDQAGMEHSRGIWAAVSGEVTGIGDGELRELREIAKIKLEEDD